MLDQIVELLRQDVRDEEDELLPRLQARLSTMQLRLLGIAWEAVRQLAPTRAHPVVARRPMGNILSALPLSLIDRSRDRAEALLHRGAGPARRPLRTLDTGLAKLARAVEYLPGMRSGEHPSTRFGKRPAWRWGPAILVALTAASAAAGARAAFKTR
jgi:hypothetical protein